MSTLSLKNMPSRGLPYDKGLKDLEMDAFKVPNILKLSRAIALESYVPVIDALNDVLINFDAASLTDGDFFYLLGYQRLKNMTSALVADWNCPDLLLREQDGLEREFTKSEMVALVEKYAAASEEERAGMTNPDELMVITVSCDHHNNRDVTFGDLQILQLNEGLKLDDALDFPRIRTYPDLLQFRIDPDLSLVAEAARWVRDGVSLQDKIDILTAQPDLVLFEKALTANTKYQHGVGRIFTLPCHKCGSIKELSIDLSASIFFDV
jgi:hypothetical protein